MTGCAQWRRYHRVEQGRSTRLRFSKPSTPTESLLFLAEKNVKSGLSHQLPTRPYPFPFPAPSLHRARLAQLGSRRRPPHARAPGLLRSCRQPPRARPLLACSAPAAARWSTPPRFALRPLPVAAPGPCFAPAASRQ
jgi:hypothetical protein